MKRQRGRNRKPGGGGGSGGSGGGGGGGGNNPNRAFESNGPENMKIRGNSQHVYERYQQLARDAFTSGDRVLAENYLQHAEHYFRVLRTLQPSRPVSEIAARDAFASGFDIDFEDESGAEGGDMDSAGSEGGEGDNGERRENGNGNGDYRRDRDDYRGENREPRDNREFNESRPQRDFGSAPKADGAPREGAPRDGEQQPREGGRREGRRERFERRNREGGFDRNQERPANSDPLAVVEPRGDALPQAEAPVREPSPGDEHLPAFLRQSAPAPAPVASETVAEDRPRRAPRKRRTEEDSAPSVETADEEV